MLNIKARNLKVKDNSIVSEASRAEFYHVAERFIQIKCQEESISQEIQCITTRQKLPNSSAIITINLLG